MSSAVGLSKPRTYFLLAAAIGLVMLASGDAAADAKRVPGSVCRFVNQSAQSSSAVFGGFQNKSGITQTVICPIARDFLHEDIRVYVRVDDNPLNTACNVVRFSGKATPVIFNPTGTEDFGDTIDVQFEGVMDGQPPYTFAVLCSLPTDRTIYAIQSAEP